MPYVSLYSLVQKSRSLCMDELMQLNGSGHPEWGRRGSAIQRCIGDKPEATPLHFKCLTLDAPSCLPSFLP